MSTFDITTCLRGVDERVDAQAAANAVTPLLNGTDVFAIKSTQVFFGGEHSHTNVDVTVRNVTHTQAMTLRKVLGEATGRTWNTPSQDYDEREKELDGKPSYGMFTTEGALAVGALLDLLEVELRTGKLPAQKTDVWLEERYEEFRAAGHSEVTDTEVRGAIHSRLERVLEELGLAVRL